jgi:predicted DNA-binding protein (MmcQ/YjbR family)
MAAAARAWKSLRAHALSFPEAWEDHPWEENVVKVGKKIFVFLGRGEGGRYGISVKLPESQGAALMLECATPTGYGLGRGGWVTIDMTHASCPPVDVLKDWILESYRAVAPKKLSAQALSEVQG